MTASRTPHIWDLLQGLLADEDVWLYDSRWRKRRKRFAHRTGLYASDTPAYRAFRVGVADDAVDVWSATIAGLFGQEHVGRVPGATAVFAEVLRLDQRLVPTSSAMVKGAWRLFFRGRPVATERAPESFHEAFRDFTRLWHLLFALVDEVGVLRRSDAGRAWLSPAGRTLNSSIPYWYALVAREDELAGPRLDALVGESLDELIGAAKVQLSKRMQRPLAERVLDALAAKHGATAQVLARTMPDSPEDVAEDLERQVSLGKLSRRGDANVSWPRYFFAYDYDWQGKSYRSDRYTYGGRDAIEGVCRFNVGDKITVYVNRDSPDQAVAKRDISHFVVGMAILGILIVLYALLGVAAAIGPEAIARRTPAMLRIGGAVIGLGILIGPLGYLVYVMLTPTC